PPTCSGRSLPQKTKPTIRNVSCGRSPSRVPSPERFTPRRTRTPPRWCCARVPGTEARVGSHAFENQITDDASVLFRAVFELRDRRCTGTVRLCVEVVTQQRFGCSHFQHLFGIVLPVCVEMHDYAEYE